MTRQNQIHPIGRPRVSRARCRGRLRLLHALALTAAVSVLGGCSGGDFGRPRSMPFDENTLPAIVSGAGRIVGTPLAFYAFTDDEQQLRLLADPLLTPPYAPALSAKAANEFGGEAPPPARPIDPAAYQNMLMAMQGSQIARYSRLIDDIQNDTMRLKDFFAIAARVIDTDREREEALPAVTTLSAVERDKITKRMADNARLVARVNRSIDERAASYRFALEHLAVLQPSPLATDAGRALIALEQQIAAIRAVPVVRGGPGRSHVALQQNG